MKIEDMAVFKKAHELVLFTYKKAEHLPDCEQFGLISQMKRAAVSIPANLIEGDSRFNKKEYEYFLKISIASCAELKYYYLLCHDLGFISLEQRDHAYRLCEEAMSLLISTKHGLSKRNE